MSIIRLFRSRRHGADRFERFAREHVDALYRLAFRLCESADGAEELVQELLVKLYPRIDELEALASPRPWLARSLYHLYVGQSGGGPLPLRCLRAQHSGQ